MPDQSPSNAPAFHNDLAASLAEGWRMLADGATNPALPMHMIAVATVSNGRTPHVRTVVLRAVNAERRNLQFHTDLRSGKIADLTQSNAVQVLAYDPAAGIQLRLSGLATIHHGDGLWHSAWQSTPPASRRLYGQMSAPGAALDNPTLENHDDGNKQNFAVVSVAVSALESLHLAADGHRRARVTWSASGQLTAQWLAP